MSNSKIHDDKNAYNKAQAKIADFHFESGSYELICRDGEIGTVSIVERSNKVSDLIKKAKQCVSEDNLDNALTEDEANESWQSYFIETVRLLKNEHVEGLSVEEITARKDDENIVYAGRTPLGKHVIYAFQDGKSTEVETDKLNNKVVFRALLGQIPIGYKDGVPINKTIYVTKFDHLASRGEVVKQSEDGMGVIVQAAKFNRSNKKLVSDLNDPVFSGKSVYFIRRAKALTSLEQ